ncbi:type IV pilus biogenesis protein PilM [Eubacterium aggregans]|uniref:type IV pilus biogenesis protein PilM n=1 Tax=Eubacterium aggregans TaxID=81409 RepID=UPI0023F468DA|nr:hypothetical protein [Eubacterium aggregans]MDD4692480.1 hypothetical protein [Eubacterium aggregans]
MQTSLYFAADSLQILQGAGKGNILIVDKFFKIPMASGGLINGVITNEGILLDALDRAREECDVDFKNVQLIINTSLAIYKNIPVPKLKPAELVELCHHEFEDAPGYEELIMDYKGIQGKGEATNMFAVALEKGVLESYMHLFETAGIKLTRIDTALSALVDYFGQTLDFQSQTFAIYVMDGNNLLYALFENGRYTFSSQARMMADRGTEAFTAEMAGKISSLVQFNKSQKSQYPLERAYFTGVTPGEIKSLKAYTQDMEVLCELLPTTDNITGKHALDDHFFLDDGFLPAVGSFEKKDAINLLRAYKKAMNPHKGIDIHNKAVIPPLILLGIFMVGFIGFFIMGIVMQKQIKDLDQYINDESNVSLYTKAQSVDNELGAVQAEAKAYDDTQTAEGSYPSFDGDKLYQVLYSGDGITTTTVSLDAKTGVLSYSGTAGNEYQAANYVNNIINSGLFASVDYLGYSYSAGSTVSTGTTSSTAQAATAPSYSFTYTALMKGGVGQ